MIEEIATQSLGGTNYFVICLDDGTAMSVVCFIRRTALVLDCLKTYTVLAKNQAKKAMKVFRLDIAAEQTSKKSLERSSRSGIRFEFCSPYATHSNGSVERLIQELQTVARTMLLACVQKELCKEAKLP